MYSGMFGEEAIGISPIMRSFIMHRFLLGIAALSALTVLASCGSSNQNTTTKTAADEAAASANNEVDCDAFMQQLADSCYAVIAFEEDGVTPLRMTDDNGNDLGEVDQYWAASYCECYAQLAFQTFGCSTVVSHEKLDDDTYASTYAPIVSACSSYDKSQESEVEEAPAEEISSEEAPAAEEAAPEEAAE